MAKTSHKHQDIIKANLLKKNKTTLLHLYQKTHVSHGIDKIPYFMRAKPLLREKATLQY